MRLPFFLAALALLANIPAAASSARDSRATANRPQIDGSDFYMFRSYEPGRHGYVTFIANYNPKQEPGSGPMYYALDPAATYDIHVSNDGDAVEDITFRFRFNNRLAGLTYGVGPEGMETSVPVPGVIAGPFGAGDDSMVNLRQTYWVQVIQGNVETGSTTGFLVAQGATAQFQMPLANIGSKSVSDYDSYAEQFVYEVAIPGCGQTGRLFAGPRLESFRANTAALRDLINVNSLTGPPDAVPGTPTTNVFSLALEVPIACVVAQGRTMIAGWTTVRLPRHRTRNSDPNLITPYSQRGMQTIVSRVGNPLVNELLIGMSRKDNFNASPPSQDSQYRKYFTHPAFPEIIQDLYPSLRAPDRFPRTDMVEVFLTGIPGLNGGGSEAELLRLNTSTPAVAADAQNRLGAVGGDMAGWPNGRRPGDDVVDSFLRVIMGRYLNPNYAPSGQAALTDGVLVNASMFDEAFPYLKAPLPGAVGTE